MVAKIDKAAFLDRLKEKHPTYIFESIEGRKALYRCPAHGLRKSDRYALLAGHGCKECGHAATRKGLVKPFEQIVADARTIHGDAYDYLEAIQERGKKTVLRIVCPEHGEFQQRMNNHIIGQQGCPTCRNLKISTGLRKSEQEWLSEAVLSRGNGYTYHGVEYRMEPKGNKKRAYLKVECPKHGIFTQATEGHISSGHSCPSCSNSFSKWHEGLVVRLRQFSSEVEIEYSIGEGRKKADIVLPSRNLVIELNGNFWHSSRYVASDHHKKRSEEFALHGYRTIHLWEHEQTNMALLALIDSAAGKPQTLLNARGCTVKQVTWKEAKDFFQTNHPQGAPVARAAHIHALYHEGRIVAAMAFQQGHVRRGGAAIADWELVRFASLAGHRVRGAASRLFSYRPEGSISSLSDNRLFTGGMYEVLGFEKQRVYGPDYFYTNGCGKMQTKQSMQKRMIEKRYGIPMEGLTEKQMAEKAGFYRVYDCGKTLWLYRPESIC